jgi:nucleotide-binding universal stress UspA family protein
MSPVKTILVGTDFSLTSELAVEVGNKLARRCGALLILLHVEPGQPATALGPAYYGIPDPGIKTIVRKLMECDTSPEVKVEHCIRAGDAAIEIERFATERPIDLIVLGSRRNTALSQVLLGSVSSHALRTSHCPVLICHLPHGCSWSAVPS